MILPAIAIPAALRKVLPYAAIAAVIALVLTLAYCVGSRAGRDGEVVKQQAGTIAVKTEAAKADAAAADARVKDVVTITEQKKELDDAIKTGESADDLRLRRGCIILRQQSGHPTGNPACSRFETGD